MEPKLCGLVALFVYEDKHTLCCYGLAVLLWPGPLMAQQMCVGEGTQRVCSGYKQKTVSVQPLKTHSLADVKTHTYPFSLC